MCIAANIPGYSTHKRRPVHRKPRNAGDIESPDRMVPFEPAGVQDGGDPSAARSGGWASPRVPAGGAVREGGASEEHAVRRRCRISGGGGTGGDPQHLPHHLRHRLFQRGRSLHRSLPHPHWPQEGTGSVANRRRLGQVHRRLLLRWHFRRHLGLLPPLRLESSLLLQVISSHLYLHLSLLELD